jgi:hypothetical protein
MSENRVLGLHTPPRGEENPPDPDHSEEQQENKRVKK